MSSATEASSHPGHPGRANPGSAPTDRPNPGGLNRGSVTTDRLNTDRLNPAGLSPARRGRKTPLSFGLLAALFAALLLAPVAATTPAQAATDPAEGVTVVVDFTDV